MISAVDRGNVTERTYPPSIPGYRKCPTDATKFEPLGLRFPPVWWKIKYSLLPMLRMGVTQAEEKINRIDQTDSLRPLYVLVWRYDVIEQTRPASTRR